MQPSNFHIHFAKTEEELRRCFPVIVQLRQHLTADSFIEHVNRQLRTDNFSLVYLLDDSGSVESVAGFRINECLSSGRYLYVDDLVTNSANRSHGYGDALFDWLVSHAKQNQCQVLELNSGVQRFAAHRFYFRKRMHVSSYKFSLKL